VNYVSGGGVMGGGSRSMSIGTGLPTAPVLSFKPGGGSADLYVTVSSSGAGRVNFQPPTVANRNNVLYWHDLRLQ
jgi:hypothetical protein